MSLGQRIKLCRQRLGLSQESLAEKVGVHPNTIRKWEKGITAPDAEISSILANTLQTTITFLYEGKDSYNDSLFIKNSTYQDKTEILNSTPSMAYWGTLVDNAEKTAEDGKNLELIINLVSTALRILKSALERENTHKANTVPSVHKLLLQ